MGGIRKYRRSKSKHKKQTKASKKVPLRDILLMVGLTTVLFGAFQGAISYRVYTVGMSEHVVNTKAGTIVVPEESPGDPGRKAGAIIGFTAAGIGILVVVFAEALPAVGCHGQVSSED